MMDPTTFHLVLVEDSPSDRLLVKHDLKEISDLTFRVSETETLNEAQQKLRAEHTDIILLDLSLPDSDGLKGLESLAREFPAVPIVILTGFDNQRVALQAFRWGAQDYLVKGESPATVLKRVLLHAMERKRVDIAMNHHRESVRTTQRMEILGRIAGKVAHDFNNILNTILGFSDLIIEDLKGHPSQVDVLEIKEAAQRGAKLTKSVLEFSVRHSSTQETCCLDVVVTGLVGALKLLLPPTAKLTTELKADQRTFDAHPAALEQVLMNLFLNARDALRPQGTITLRTGLSTLGLDQTAPTLEPGEYLVLEVEDDGKGMDEICVNRMFDPFFTTKVQGGGTGLGLSTVIDFVRTQRGKIQVDSQPDRGTRVTLYLPQTKTKSTGDTVPRLGQAIVLDEDLFSEPQYAEVFEERGLQVVRLSPEDISTVTCDPDVLFLFLEGRDADQKLLRRAGDLASECSGLQVVLVTSHSDEDSQHLPAPLAIATLWRPINPRSLSALLRKPRFPNFS